MFLCILGIISCSKEDDIDVKLCFVGDSMVANWDVERSFPNRRVKNNGVDGIGLKEISDMHLSKPEEDVILLVGTNDIKPSITDAELNAYAFQYIGIITQLNARRVILISILPTADKEKNQKIEKVNKRVREETLSLSSVVYVDCYSCFFRDGVIKEGLSRDGTHLNDYGYLLLTDIVKERL